MKQNFSPLPRTIAIIGASLLTLITNGFGLIQQTNGITSMGWQMLKTTLPEHPLAMAASTDANNPDFVAVASDGSEISFYFLDHSNLQLGWQKSQYFLGAEFTNLQYGLGHFVAMGIDRSSGKPVVSISADHGRTWTQDLIFAGTGHYDNAAFSEKMGIMTGKDGSLAVTTDGMHWVETTPPNGTPRKIVYTNIAPPGAPVDNQFELCVALPPGQISLAGFLAFHDVPVIGSLISIDGKTWTYTIPYPIIRNQLLIYQNKTFLVTDSLAGISYAYHNSTNLGEADFQGLQLDDPLLPIISIFQFASYQQNWVAVGYDIKTNMPLSLFSDSKILNNNLVFSTDFFPKAVGLVAANQCGFLAVADDGTTYYSTPITVP